jgi:nucleotide-binding universal stress UspA family protein
VLISRSTTPAPLWGGVDITEGIQSMTVNLAPIVAGVDGSPHSVRALGWAAREASARGCPLRIVHAFLWPMYDVPLGSALDGPLDTAMHAAADGVLSDAVARARRAAPGLEVSAELTLGGATSALVDASHEASLVVVGHRGRGGLAGLLVGSVGVQTAAHAHCPVIVVRDGGHADIPGPATGHVVVGVDGSDMSSLAVDFAFAYAALHRLGVLAVHAHHLPTSTAPDYPRAATYPVDARGRPSRLLADALNRLRDRYPEVAVRQKVIHAAPADALLASSGGAALTVVGSRGRGGFTGLLLGSTSQDVLHHATGPVAVVRAHPSRQRGGAARLPQNVPVTPDRQTHRPSR